jgi:hypothetical protein
MVTKSELPDMKAAAVRRALSGLPRTGYEVVVKPLRYRTAPHLAALCDFDSRTITLQVPRPFRPFKEAVNFGARRKRGEGMQFRWLSETVAFRSRRDVLRFLYLHEWMHWHLHEVLRRGSSAETACDRFALLNFRRPRVTAYDAAAALSRRGPRPHAVSPRRTAA